MLWIRRGERLQLGDGLVVLPRFPQAEPLRVGILPLVDGRAQSGAAADPDVTVRASDSSGFYDLFVNRRLDVVEVEGDADLLERLVEEADFQSELSPVEATA